MTGPIKKDIYALLMCNFYMLNGTLFFFFSFEGIDVV